MPPNSPFIQRSLSEPRYEGLALRLGDLSPLEAIEFSRNRRALGYEEFRWGEKFEEVGANNHVALATPLAVMFLPRLDLPYVSPRTLGSPEEVRKSRLTALAKRKYAEAKKWELWNDLSHANRDYILSLIWIPEEPMGPLESLAQAAK